MIRFSAFFTIALFAFLFSRCSQAAPKNGKGSQSKQAETTYGVIIDCGSSGTRVHFYEWDTSLEFPDLLNKIEPMRDQSDPPKAISKKITPGLSSLKNNPSRASDYMKPILDFIHEKIPSQSYKSTSIYMMATAGMRLLDESTQRKILDDVANDLRYTHEFAKVKISIITGATEGMYQWITVNSKLRRFSPKELSTVGMMEMGGSSIQVTFQLKPQFYRLVMDRLKDLEEAKFALTSQIVEPELSREAVGYPYKLVSVSFLGLGSNSARDAYVDLLIHHKLNHHKRFNQFFFKKQPLLDSNNNIVLKDPCLPTGAEETIQRPKKMLDPAYNRNQSVGFNIEAGDETFNVKIIGESNYWWCRLRLGEMLSRAKKEKLNCQNRTCSMSLLKTKFIPYDHVDFIGLGEFYYTTNEILDVAGRYNRFKVLRRSFNICSKKYAELQSEFSEVYEKDPDRVMKECFKAVWIETFLTDGLMMPLNYNNIITVGKINSDEVDWTLGAVLDKSLAIERAAEAN